MRIQSVPYATREALNRTAFDGQKIARSLVRNKMILRNNYTVQSIRVDRAKTLSMSGQYSVLGSIASYMLDQEFGAVQVKQGRHGVAIPTAYSAGQGRGTQPRTLLPLKINKLQNILLSKRAKSKAMSIKQRLVITVQEAVHKGPREVFLDLGRKQGIFRVVGGRRGTKRGWPKGARLQMLHDLSHDAVVIPRTPWLKPSALKAAEGLQRHYRMALIYQLKRLSTYR